MSKAPICSPFKRSWPAIIPMTRSTQLILTIWYNDLPQQGRGQKVKSLHQHRKETCNKRSRRLETSFVTFENLIALLQ